MATEPASELVLAKQMAGAIANLMGGATARTGFDALARACAVLVDGLADSMKTDPTRGRQLFAEMIVAADPIDVEWALFVDDKEKTP